jgi:hypothetical protein
MWLVVQDLGILLAQTGHWIRRLDYKPGPDGHFAQLRGHRPGLVRTETR